MQAVIKRVIVYAFLREVNVVKILCMEKDIPFSIGR